MDSRVFNHSGFGASSAVEVTHTDATIGRIARRSALALAFGDRGGAASARPIQLAERNSCSPRLRSGALFARFNRRRRRPSG